MRFISLILMMLFLMQPAGAQENKEPTYVNVWVRDSVEFKGTYNYFVHDIQGSGKWALAWRDEHGLVLSSQLEFDSIAVSPLPNWCFTKKDGYWRVHNMFTNEYSGFSALLPSMSFIGVTGNHGAYMSDGDDIFFEDGLYIESVHYDQGKYKIGKNDDGQLTEIIGESEIPIDENRLDYIWLAGSLYDVDDDLKKWMITEVIDDSTYIISPRYGKTFAILYESGAKVDTVNLNRIDEVVKVEGIDGYYLLTSSEYNESYLWDVTSQELYSIYFDGYYRTARFPFFIGNHRGRPYFRMDDLIYGLDGFTLKTDRMVRLDEVRSREKSDSLYFVDDIHGAWVPINMLHSGKVLTELFKKDKVNEWRMTLGKYYNDDDEDSVLYSSNLIFSIPDMKEYDKRLKQNILYWIAERVASINGKDDLGVATRNLTEETLFDQIRSLFVQSFEDYLDHDIYIYYHGWGGYHGYWVHRTLDADNLVSLEFYNSNTVAGNVGNDVSYAATFDKTTCQRLSLSDIIEEDALPTINRILSHQVKRTGSDFFDTPVAMGENGLIFINDIVNAKDFSIYNLEVPYDSISQWLKIVPKGTKYRSDKSLDMTFEQPFLEVPPGHDTPDGVYLLSRDLLREYATKTIDNDKRRAAMHAEMNGGRNLCHAKSLLKTNPAKAADIFGWLAEEEGEAHDYTGSFANYYMLYSWICVAKDLYEEGKYEKAQALCKRVLDYDRNYLDTLLFSSIQFCNETKKMFADILKSERSSAKVGQEQNNILEGINFKINNYKAEADVLLTRIGLKTNQSENLDKYVYDVNLNLDNSLDGMTRFSKEERAYLWDYYKDWYFTDIQKVAAMTDSKNMKKYAYDALLIAKGLLLNMETSVTNRIQNGDNVVAKRILGNILEQEKKINQLRLKNKKKEMNSAEEVLKNLYGNLYREISYSSGMTMDMILSWRVAKSLAEDELAIEFADVAYGNDTIYYALCLDSKENIGMIRLCSSSELRSITWNDYEDGRLYDLVWKPLEGLLKDKRAIMFAPSGLLHTISIENAYDKQQQSFMAEKYLMRRLTSTRHIVEAREPNEDTGSSRNALLVGGLNYNADTHTEDNLSDESYSSSLMRGGILKNLRIKNLPGSEEEINNIVQFIPHVINADSVTVLSGDEGTETAFKKEVTKHPHLLHIATHGFYMSDNDLHKLDKNNYFAQIDNSYRDFDERQLVRSGLVFAGANKIFQNPKYTESVDDGILTTLEISGMDFHDVDLAVLSCCQSGDGTITSDGVLGLQRGFKKAGAKTILMSLWKVNDSATSILMKKFYENLAKEMTTTEALRIAQQSLREFDKGIYDDPYYWAAFVLLDAL